MGTPATVGDWELMVFEAIPDGTEAVLSENQFNDPPDGGKQFYLVALGARYLGDDSGLVWTDLILKTLGPSAVAYESGLDSCGVIPNDIDNTGEVFPGGFVTGLSCWSVSEEDAGDLLLLAEEFSFSSDRVAFELDPTAAVIAVPDVMPGVPDLGEPVQLGSTAQVGDCLIRITGTTPDATAAVLAENQFNEPPGDGEQFFLVAIEAEYVGTESGSFWLDLTLKAVGPRAVAFESSEHSCGVIPGPIDDTGETFPGGVVFGNECWRVNSDEVSELIVIVTESFSFDDERVVYALK